MPFLILQNQQQEQQLRDEMRPLVAGDIVGHEAPVILVYNVANDCWLLANPAHRRTWTKTVEFSRDATLLNDGSDHPDANKWLDIGFQPSQMQVLQPAKR